jgi:hypothetical protein
MTYEEWLSSIEEINKTSINMTVLEKMKNAEINMNINEMLYPKLVSAIRNRFTNSINKIINSLDIVFSDKNYLDLELLNFKKELKFLDELTRLKQIPDEIKIDLFSTLVNESNNVYNILEKEADKIDYTGVYGSIIRNNRIKWSE